MLCYPVSFISFILEVISVACKRSLLFLLVLRPKEALRALNSMDSAELHDDFILDSQLWELLSFFSGLARSFTHFTSARDVNDCDLPVKKLDKPLLREGRFALRDFMWKRGSTLASGIIGGGEKPHEELPLSVMSSEEAEEAVESGEEIEKEDEDEDKSHVDLKRDSAVAALKDNAVLKS